MRFKQYDKDGSCDMEFTYGERLRILFKGKIHFNSSSFKHVVNNMALMIFSWQRKFDKKTGSIQSNHEENIKTK
jgi:hypothetical protein